MDLQTLQRHVVGNTFVRGVDQVPKGHLRIETGFLYPDGSSVDLFLVQQVDLFHPMVLTDLGETTAWLLTVQVKPWLSKKRKGFVEDALRIYGARQTGGALEIDVPAVDALADSILHLGQACVRVADLTYTRRSALQTVFTEQVEEVLADIALEYQPNTELLGRFGHVVRVDFLVSGHRTRSAVLTWSTGNPNQAHIQANEIFRRWYDLDIPERAEQRVTVFDDGVDVYKDDDMQRLRGVSAVLPLSDRQAVFELLAA